MSKNNANNTDNNSEKYSKLCFQIFVALIGVGVVGVASFFIHKIFEIEEVIQLHHGARYSESENIKHTKIIEDQTNELKINENAIKRWIAQSDKSMEGYIFNKVKGQANFSNKIGRGEPEVSLNRQNLESDKYKIGDEVIVTNLDSPTKKEIKVTITSKYDDDVAGIILQFPKNFGELIDLNKEDGVINVEVRRAQAQSEEEDPNRWITFETMLNEEREKSREE